jgi:hypothetical protein
MPAHITPEKMPPFSSEKKGKEKDRHKTMLHVLWAMAYTPTTAFFFLIKAYHCIPS